MKKIFILITLLLTTITGCGFLDLNDNLSFISKEVKTFAELRTESGYQADFGAIGDQQILILPIKFKGESLCGQTDTCREVLDDLNTTFFGATEDTGWESVTSYYSKSSYGQLNIDGKVAPDWIELDKTSEQIKNLSTNIYADPTMYILRYAVEQYKILYDDIADFDTDGDGNIDLVWLVYDATYDLTGRDSILWAYTFWDYTNYAKRTKDNPMAYTYAWASYDFMYEGNYGKPDAHTFIHETGHTFGLDDYYTYDTKDLNNAAGGLEMMDLNIGDHNAYSKYLLSWVEPIVIDQPTTVTINPFESSGDCLLIPSNSYKNNPMGEYLMVEFYTPTGLNYLDSTQNYSGSTPLLYTEIGIKIYHVDSRIGVFNASHNFLRYTDVTVKGNYYLAIAHSNTKSQSANTNYVLLHLLEKSGTNTFKNGKYANNSTLFYQGDSFAPLTSHKNMFYHKTTFNDGTPFDFSLSIDNIDETGATLTYHQIVQI